MRFAAAAGLAALAGALAGCGNAYRPVVASIGVTGPAGQPTKYAIAVSSPTPTSPGIMTMVDFSGDTIVDSVTLGVNPYYFVLNGAGTEGYSLNSDKTVTSFQVNTSLIESQVSETTLLPGSNPVSFFASTSNSYIPDPGVNAIDQLTSTPPALKQELPVSAGYSPLYIVGEAGSSRAYSINPSTTGGLGQVSAIEVNLNTISTTLPVGRGPVYGVMTPDFKRAFILNQTDGTVSVINVPNNALDTPVNTIPVGTQPVWADFAYGLNEMVVANKGNGVTPGSLSIVEIPLCTAITITLNPNCDPTNPIDATSFGTVVATVPLGINPIMVSVLADLTRAYVANAGNPNLPCAANGIAVAGVSTSCTISVVNLTSNTVTATIPIKGHPAYIATATSTPTGKVYVVCNDSQVLTVIETDTDTIDTTIPLQGNGVSVRVTSP
jgi:DNA-binding beta-propeller fold protein YncE